MAATTAPQFTTGQVQRVIAALHAHRADQVVHFVAGGMNLATKRATSGWTLQRVEDTATRIHRASLLVGENREYARCRHYLVIDTDGAVVADADDLDAALGTALHLLVNEPVSVHEKLV